MIKKRTWVLGLCLMTSCAAPRVATLPELTAFQPAAVQHEQGGAGGHHHKNHIALFTGVVNKDESNGTNTTVSAIGVDFEHRLDDKWGVGLLAEVGSHPFTSTTLAVPVYIHPMEHVTLMVAPGLENEHGHINFMTRFGGSYGIDVGNGVTMSPGVYYDVVEHAENGWVFGVSFGIGF